jgi:protein SCO1/2
MRSTLVPAVLSTALTLTLSVALSGCRHPSSSADTPDSASANGSSSTSKSYPIHGTVLKVGAADKQIVLQHEAIPGLMEAMTMSYPVTDPATLSELHPGDKIAATMLADPSSHGPVNLRLADIVITAQARPDYVPAVQYHVPTAGDQVPDFTLLNQSDHTIDFKQFRGKVLLITFIYTRCPLSDYCPRMSRNFAEIDQQLAADPQVYNKTHLLSISFDPTYDTPKVLKSYGGAYTGKYSNETFKHWEFAAPTQGELPKMEQFFDVGVTPAGNGTLQHSLATVVIGKDGKVIAFYPTNDWSVPAVLAQVKAAAQD